MTSKKRKGTKGPKRDQFFEFAKEFAPLTQTQSEAYQEYKDGKSLMLCGYPGTGKTYMACAFALEELAQGSKSRIRFIRTAHPTKDLGFLPGTEKEKLEVYEKVFAAMVNKNVGRGDAYDILKNEGRIIFESTSYLRGLTFENEVIIVDECQNMQIEEIDTIITRLGRDSVFIFCGDRGQTDPKAKSGFDFLKNICQRLEGYFSTHEFLVEDIVRSGLVKEYIIQKLLLVNG